MGGILHSHFGTERFTSIMLSGMVLTIFTLVSPLQAEEPINTNGYNIIARKSEISTFPCHECHKTYDSQTIEPNALTKKHKDLTFKHNLEVMQCTFCHSRTEVDKLNLLDGTLISYDESFKLCQQCHGTREKDWREGIHGRLVGSWKGARELYNCTKCHEAHSPVFKPMESVALPPIPKLYIKKDESGRH